MATSPKIFLIILMILVFGLTGCELPRDGEGSDLQPVEALPPTLAPLGAENGSLAAEATVVPTVINVQPTATTSNLAAGEAAPSPGEPVAPTSQPAGLQEAPAATNSQVEQAATSPETFVGPESAPANDEPVVVDATTQQAADPIAANPPASETGSYETTGYGQTSYTVQSGDTLFSIGTRYGTTAEAIMVANGLNSDIVYAGQELVIPAGDVAAYPQPAEQSAIPSTGNGAHIVGQGETLFRIALNYGATVEAIAAANGIPYPYTIFPGQRLIVPSAGAYPAPASPPANDYYPPANAYPSPGPADGYSPVNPYAPPVSPGEPYYPAPDSSNMMPGMDGTHTVAPGETLYLIAQRYGTTAEALAYANGLANPNQIYVGQVLYLP